MLTKLISNRQTLKVIREYYPKPYLITKHKTTFCVWLDDSPAKPLVGDPSSATGIIFTVNRSEMNIKIEHIHVHPTKSGMKFANKLLDSLWAFYLDFNFQQVSLVSVNDSFWQHIRKKSPWINFNITKGIF